MLPGIPKTGYRLPGIFKILLPGIPKKPITIMYSLLGIPVNENLPLGTLYTLS